MRHRNSVLILLVTCSLEDTRRNLEIETTKNLIELLKTERPPFDLLLFDNASLNREHLSDSLNYGEIYVARENYGYWSAVNWVLNSYIQPSCEYEFIYIIESDTIHESLMPIVLCAKALEKHLDVCTVRTQKFSRKKPLKYNKKYSFLPAFIHDYANAVSFINHLTNEKGSFAALNDFENLYRTNLHPKLPGLHRIKELREIFNYLSNFSEFSEMDFYRIAGERFSQVLIHEPGFWKTLVSSRDNGTLSGSFSNENFLAQLGYMATRNSKIININKMIVTKQI